jgi:flavin reductase ActVB
MPVSEARFRAALSRFASGVTVITVVSRESALGMTASAFTSLSLDPPMVLVCVGHEASLHELFVSAEWFGIHVLAAGQRHLAEQYSRHGRQPLEAGSPSSPAGLPLIGGALAHLDCRRRDVFRGGDHSIVTGVVEWAEEHDGDPLVYFQAAYSGLGR